MAKYCRTGSRLTEKAELFCEKMVQPGKEKNSVIVVLFHCRSLHNVHTLIKLSALGSPRPLQNQRYVLMILITLICWHLRKLVMMYSYLCKVT